MGNNARMMKALEYSEPRLENNGIYTGMVRNIADTLSHGQRFFETEPEITLKRALLLRENQGIPTTDCVSNDESHIIALQNPHHWLNVQPGTNSIPEEHIVARLRTLFQEMGLDYPEEFNGSIVDVYGNIAANTLIRQTIEAVLKANN